MSQSLRWIGVDRGDLPGVIAEGALPEKARASVSDVELALNETPIAIGMTDRNKPVIAALDDSSARETIAWLATYSSGSFPISQSMRVVSSSDLRELFKQPNRFAPAFDSHYWSSIVLGELLGQGEQALKLEDIPISRATSCFSYAQARAEMASSFAPKFTEGCERRLRSLEADKLFVRRAIAADELSAIWEWTRKDGYGSGAQHELMSAIDAVTGDRVVAGRSEYSHLTTIGFDVASLATGPAEDRVRSFQNFAATLSSIGGTDNVRSASMFLAAAAICVGNGTTHVSLLRDFWRTMPGAFAWFGLFAAVGGPKCWDSAWNRAANSIGRFLRASFDALEPPVCDLSWIEYEFVRGVASPIQFLRQLPKLNARSLSIEIVPGSVCQLRINDESSVTRGGSTASMSGREPSAMVVRTEPSPPSQATTKPSGQSELVAELESTLRHAQSLVRRLMPTSEGSIQQGMFEDVRPTKGAPKRGQRKGR